MKITRRQLRKIIKEAMDPVRVKTAALEDFDPPVWSDATEPRSSETPQKKVGNFFMTKASDGMPTRGYSALKKLKNFYVTLPDGEAIRIGSFPGDPSSNITKVKDGVRYLEALDSGVDVLSISDHNNPSEKDIQNMLDMQDQIMAVAKAFKL
tara:strand:+ start:196 stop:651 length:456 start_codon:yes stop_codon:yes gene_type:complete